MLLILAACHANPPLPQQRFDLKGKVVAVNKNEGTVTLAHQAIPGYMAAMTMDYAVKDKWALDVLKPGQNVTATLVVATDRAWIEGLVIGEAPQPDPHALAAAAASPLGKEVPDFHLINQDGKAIHLHQYRGKALLLTFIYTRCPLPDYCPRTTRNFAQILQQVRADPQLASGTHLLSISIDPDYDQPAVLREYGRRLAGTARPFSDWEFAAGTPEQVKKTAEFFGLKYWTENGQIVHTLVVALVGPDGKVAHLYPGNDWPPAQVVADLKSTGGAAR
jgi:protein SCO1/2